MTPGNVRHVLRCVAVRASLYLRQCFVERVKGRFVSRGVSRTAEWGRDAGLTFRMFGVMFLLIVLYLGFMAVLVASGAEFTFIALIAIVILGVQYFFSDRLALWSVGAKVVTPEQAPELHAMVERLAQIADLPKPKVAVADTNVPNAFATGRNPQNAAVAVTRGLMSRLNREELEGVIAHELAHIRNRDVMVMTLASFFAVVAQMIMRSLFFTGAGRQRGGNNNGAGVIMLVWVASLLVWVISYFLIRALSRYREFAADRGAALITGSPQALMSALMKISGVMDRVPQQDLREVSDMNAFFIIPAAPGGRFSEIFSTHPSLERRLDSLRELQRQMEGM
jgi:heat shock protein HtpX